VPTAIGLASEATLQGAFDVSPTASTMLLNALWFIFVLIAGSTAKELE